MPRRRSVLLLAVTTLLAFGCRKVEIRARCTVRPAGSFCTFQNTGAQPGRACFRIVVRHRGGGSVLAQARACSQTLQSGEESAAQVIAFDLGDPYAQCTLDPATGQPRDCITQVSSERLEPQ